MVKNNLKDNGVKRGRRFLVFGRVKPSEKNPEPEPTVVRVFANNQAYARSKFWKIMRLQKKIKKSTGEVLRVQELFDSSKVTAKNFGIYLKYRSNVGTKNLFKEFRDVNIAGAISQLYNEMGGNYKVSKERVEIIRYVELEQEDMKVRNPRCLRWINQDQLQFPLWQKTSRRTDRKYDTNFVTNKPCCYKTGNSVNAQ